MSKPPLQRPGATSTLKASTETLRVGDAPPVTPTPFVQPEAPAPAEVSPAKPAPKKEKKKTPTPADGDAPRSARAAFEASVLLARNHPHQWEPYSVRLPKDLWARLRDRQEVDQAAYRMPSIAMSHYINAALDRIPADLEEAADMASAHMLAQGMPPPASRSSGTRLHQDVLARMELLPTRLSRVSRPGLLGHLQAAALEAFLDELDAG